MITLGFDVVSAAGSVDAAAANKASAESKPIPGVFTIQCRFAWWNLCG